MLLFSTILDINHKMTKENFLQLVIEWNQGSPHESNIIPDMEWTGGRSFKYEYNNLWLEVVEYRNKNIIAVRYEKKEDNGVIWDTDYVMNFNMYKMSVRLDRSYSDDAISIDAKFSTPHFITLLIENGYIERDVRLKVNNEPLMITQDNLRLITDVINGNNKYSLPIVFVSKTYYDTNPIDIRLLSRRLKGVAHVLVQESKDSNSELKLMCEGKNEYFGAIGIYFFKRGYSHTRYLYKGNGDYDHHLMEKTVRNVIQYSNSQRVDALYTWQGVNNELLRDRLTAQRAERQVAEKARKEAEEIALRLENTLDEEEQKIRKKAKEDAKIEASKLLEMFDSEVQDLQNQIEGLTNENERLLYENSGLKSKLNLMDTLPLIFMGVESDFYQGEIREMVLDAIYEKCKELEKGTRRSHVLQDIIDTNNYTKIRKDREQKVKNLFNGYISMSGAMRQELKNLGFTISEEGKHYKLTYYDDPRYTTTIAKTGSDNRGGKNIAGNILKDMM